MRSHGIIFVLGFGAVSCFLISGCHRHSDETEDIQDEQVKRNIRLIKKNKKKWGMSDEWEAEAIEHCKKLCAEEGAEDDTCCPHVHLPTTSDVHQSATSLSTALSHQRQQRRSLDRARPSRRFPQYLPLISMSPTANSVQQIDCSTLLIT